MDEKSRKAWNRFEFDDIQLRTEYLNGRPVVEIAEEYRCSPPTVYRRLRELGVVRNRSEAAKGQTPWNKRGHYKDSQGYIYIQLPEDSPFLAMTTGRRYVREHRLVMAQYLGRPLERWEIVHHHNAIRDDNRIENLELFPNQGNHLSMTRLVAENEKLRQELKRCRAALKLTEGKEDTLGCELADKEPGPRWYWLTHQDSSGGHPNE